MRARHLVAILAALAMQAALGQRTRPAGGDLSGRIHDAVRALPSVNAEVTEAQRTEGGKACALYRAAYAQRSEMGGYSRTELGLLGLHAGFAAGDAEVMLSGAKLLHREAARSKLEEYSAYALTWAGIFAGDPASARAGLERLMRRPSKSKLHAWARQMEKIAEECDQPISLALALPGGRTANLTALRGKVVVIEIGASRCPPWVNALPGLKAFHAARAEDPDFFMFGISLDERAADARRTVAEHDVPWPVGVAPVLREKFHGKGAPHVAVISPRGRVLWQGHPVAKGMLAMTTDFARREAGRLAGGPTTASSRAAPATRAGASPPPSPAARTEAEAEAKLNLAETYRKAGMPAKARSLLREVLETYPRTSAAAKAREALKDLP